MENLSDLEIKAEVYKIIKANQDKRKSVILKSIKDHLPEIETAKINKALYELSL